jgi:acetyl esterase/lipase
VLGARAGVMRATLLSIGLLFGALGLLTVFRAPDWVDWRLAVIADQFGYALALVPFAAGLLAWYLPGDRGICGSAAIAACAAAVLLLVRPCAQAWLMGRRLPGALERSFGPVRLGAQPFTLAGLVRPWPGPVPKTTWTYSGALQLDFYAAAGRSPAPCVFVIHGGGWDNGDRGQMPHFNYWLARNGYSVADISYRLAPASIWPAQREDVAAAVAFVKAHAVAWDVDAGRLVIMGRSAGGQIAEASAYYLHDPAVRGVIALYAPADMNFAWEWGREDDALNSPRLLRRFLGGTPETAGPAYDSASAILLVDAKTPPTLLVHGEIDTLVWNRQSERLAARLTEAGDANMLVSMPWAAHALEYNLSGPSGQLTTYSVGWFLGAVCR